MSSAPDPAESPSQTLAGNSTAVAAWTVVSRLTGFARIAVVGAVLGPTFLGNLFLAVNQLPNLVLQLMGGSLVATVLIPSLVPSADRGDRREAGVLAGGFLGASLAVLAGVGLVAVAAAPIVLDVLSVGVEDRAVAADQQRLGWVLMATTMPQLPLYAVALIGGAVMNAHGRFALAAAAPVAENLGVMVTMGAFAAAFGTGLDVGSAGTAEMLVLGGGSTLAVLLHAGVMWWGAARSGVRLRPRRGWRAPAVAALLRRMTASLALTSLGSLRYFAMVTVANTVPAGVVAFQLAINFLYLPVQVGGRPISLTLLPPLSRLHKAGRLQAFRDEYTRGIVLVAFLTVPAAVAYLVLAGPLGHAVSFGELAGSTGPALVSACLAGLAVAVVAESLAQLATFVSYARDDTRSPLVGGAVGTVATIACLAVALALEDGEAVLAMVGASFSAASVLTALVQHLRLRAALPAPERHAGPPLLRTLAASAVMAGPAYAVGALLSAALDEPLGALFAVVAAAAAGAAVFLGLQRLWRSPELAFFAGGLRRMLPRGA